MMTTAVQNREYIYTVYTIMAKKYYVLTASEQQDNSEYLPGRVLHSVQYFRIGILKQNANEVRRSLKIFNVLNFFCCN
jgi:hypothetical protein